MMKLYFVKREVKSLGSINLYKIDNDKEQTLLTSLASKMNLIKSVRDNKEINKIHVDFKFTLYLSKSTKLKNVKWNWLLNAFEQHNITVNSTPSAVLLIKINDNEVYAATFGHSFFYVEKFADTDFGVSFARKIDFEEIKTTTLTTPNSHRNKTVSTYINYSELEFDSGESFAKLKARAVLPEGFSLFKPSLEIGTSIRFTINNDSLEDIEDILLYVKNIIETQDDKYHIPVFSRVKDKEKISKLENNLYASIKENPEIYISELEIVGATEIFNRNDSEYKLKYGRKEKIVSSFSNDEIKIFCDEESLNYSEVVLDIKVIGLVDGDPVSTTSVKNLIDFTDDKLKCLLSKGIWYSYNEDYLKYLRDSINEIKTEYHPEFDFSSKKHDDFIKTFLDEARLEPCNIGKTDKEIFFSLKKKYYAERAFNMLMERDYDFKNYDRNNLFVGSSSVELMDLYKNKTMYAVKIGASSAKLCYVVDQSMSSLRLYKHKLLKNMPQIDTVAIWIVLERKKHIEKDGIPDINKLDMLMLKNRIDEWKKEVRLQGYTPIIYVNYKID